MCGQKLSSLIPILFKRLICVMLTCILCPTKAVWCGLKFLIFQISMVAFILCLIRQHLCRYSLAQSRQGLSEEEVRLAELGSALGGTRKYIVHAVFLVQWLHLTLPEMMWAPSGVMLYIWAGFENVLGHN